MLQPTAEPSVQRRAGPRLHPPLHHLRLRPRVIAHVWREVVGLVSQERGTPKHAPPIAHAGTLGCSAASSESRKHSNESRISSKMPCVSAI